MRKIIGIKVIFFKDWGQIGCKYFDIINDNNSISSVEEWLDKNHKNINKRRFLIVRE